MGRAPTAVVLVAGAALALCSCLRLFGSDCPPGAVETCLCPDGVEREVVCPARCDCDQPVKDASPECGDAATYPEGCGDGLLCPPEQCDDGRNGDPCDGCLDTCEEHLSTCGDALLCGAEACDDGVNDGAPGRCAVGCVAGPPARLAFVQEPSDGTAGVAISPSTSVVVEDSEGRRVRGATVAITLALEHDPTGGVVALAGDGPVAAVDGVATFPSLVLDTAAAGYVLRAVAGALAPATSVAFDVSAAVSWPAELADWQYRKRITVLPRTPGASLSDFPLLLSLDADADLRDRARTDGFDLRFIGADGLLSHEIEAYVGGTGALVAWVRVPVLDTTTETALYLYYGNPAASADPSDAAVWSNGFVAVWHLDETGGGTPGEYRDATGHGNDATGGGGSAPTTPAREDGVVGMGQRGDGVDDFIATPASMNGLSRASVSLWVYLRSVTNIAHPGLVGQNDAVEIGFYWEDRLNVWTPVMTATCDDRPVQSLCTSEFDLGAWLYVAVTWDGDEGVLYVDGVERHSAPSELGSSTELITLMGRVFDPTGNHLDGVVDEVRLADTDRPGAWFAHEHANQRDPASFSVLGPEERRP